MDENGETQLTQDDIGYNLEPAYSADGQSIVYRRNLYVNNIYAASVGGTSSVALSVSGADFTPTYSPDKQSLVFSTQRNGPASALWIANANGQNAVALLDNQNLFSESEPDWSSDGGRIAYTSTRSGAPNIWVLSLLKVSDFTVLPTLFSPAGTSACGHQIHHLQLQAFGVQRFCYSGHPVGKQYPRPEAAPERR